MENNIEPNEIYGQWFFNMLDANNLTLDGFLALDDNHQADLWMNNKPLPENGYTYHSELEQRLDFMYGDIWFKE